MLYSTKQYTYMSTLYQQGGHLKMMATGKLGQLALQFQNELYLITVMLNLLFQLLKKYFNSRIRCTYIKYRPKSL